MFWPSVDVPIVIVVPEVPGRAGSDQLAASPAVDLARLDAGLPRRTALLVPMTVAAVRRRAAGHVHPGWGSRSRKVRIATRHPRRAAPVLAAANGEMSVTVPARSSAVSSSSDLINTVASHVTSPPNDTLRNIGGAAHDHARLNVVRPQPGRHQLVSLAHD